MPLTIETPPLLDWEGWETGGRRPREGDLVRIRYRGGPTTSGIVEGHAYYGSWGWIAPDDSLLDRIQVLGWQYVAPSRRQH